MPLNAVKLAPPPTKFAAVITPDTASIPVELIVTADPTVATPITFIFSVLITSVLARPVKEDPSPEKLVAVTIPV